MYTLDLLNKEARQRALKVLELVVATEFHSDIESYVLNFLANNGLAGKADRLMVYYEIRDSVAVSISGEMDLKYLEKYLGISLGDLKSVVVQDMEIMLDFKQEASYNPIINLVKNHVSQTIGQLNSILSKSYSQIISRSNLLKYSGNLCFTEDGIPLVSEKLMSYTMKELCRAISEDLRMIFGSYAILADIQAF